MTWHNITQNQRIASRAIISALVLWLALCGMAAGEQLYVNESGWWRDGGAFNASGTPIQAAVGAAAEGDAIYVDSGSYTENVDVNKTRLTLQGEGADVVTVTAADSGNHVFEVTADWVNISGLEVTGATSDWAAGIYLNGADHCKISGNNASNNDYGIYLRSSSHTLLTNNTANSNNFGGIWLLGSSNSILTGNIASNNYFYGIHMSSSSSTTLQNNTMSGNTYNFDVVSSYSLSYYMSQNIDMSNTVNEKPIYYWVDQQDKQIPDDAGYVGIVNCTNITVKDLTLTNNGQGIFSICTENSRIENVTTSNNSCGICLLSSSDNTLGNNTANSNNGEGIFLFYSNNNMLQSNIADSNGNHGIRVSGSEKNDYNNSIDTTNTVNGKPVYYFFNKNGIVLDGLDAGHLTLAYCSDCTVKNSNVSNGDSISIYSSSNNTLGNNTANSNNRGICLDYSSNNLLANNTANSNIIGIELAHSSNNNMLTNNTANSNNWCGISLYSSSSNTLRNNTANSNKWGIFYMSSSSSNDITCNWVQNNTERGFYLTGGSTDNNISYNNIIENGNYNATSGGWEWQFYSDQSIPVDAKHNYWGAGMNSSTIDASIYDDEEGQGEVGFYPFETDPVQCPLTPEPPAFTTTDAVIALQIAVGSRPSDSRWDVSGDGSVTSLDALMIMQALAG